MDYENTTTDYGKMSVGMGYITDITESDGMQSSYLSTTNIPAINLHTELTFGYLSILGEFVRTLRHFSITSSYQTKDAEPVAIHLETDYAKTIFRKPLVFGLAYGQTWQALALNLPKNSYTAVVNVSFWKDTMATFEFRHDVNYAVDKGSGYLVNRKRSIQSNQNIVTLQFGIYF